MESRILIVDDEEYLLNAMNRALRLQGTELVLISDPEEALAYVEKNNVDIVISDVNMPKMKGTELYHKIKQFNPFIQVIIMTGYPTFKLIVSMLEAGAADFIIKPFDNDQLVAIIQENLNRVKRWQHLKTEWIKYKNLYSE